MKKVSKKERSQHGRDITFDKGTSQRRRNSPPSGITTSREARTVFILN